MSSRSQILQGVAALSIAASLAHAAVTPFSGSESARPESEGERRMWSQAEEFARSIERSGALYRDETVRAHVQAVMDRLFPEFGGRIRIHLMQAPQLNAFAIPDGNIYINIGLVARFENNAQLATVLAHEGTHFTHRHGFRNQTNVKSSAAFGTIAAMLGVPIFPELLAFSSIFGFSREMETEADKVGYDRLVRAGYDAREAPKVFEHLLAEVKAEKIEEPFFFASHPKLKDRVANMRELSAKGAAGGDGGSRSEYSDRMRRVRLDNLEGLLSIGRARSALLVLEDPVRLNELPPHAHYFAGEAYRLRGDEGDALRAETAYLKAVEAAPEFAPSYRALGIHYLKLNQYTEAERNLVRYLELAPDAKDRAYVEQYLKTSQKKGAKP